MVNPLAIFANHLQSLLPHQFVPEGQTDPVVITGLETIHDYAAPEETHAYILTDSEVELPVLQAELLYLIQLYPQKFPLDLRLDRIVISASCHDQPMLHFAPDGETDAEINEYLESDLYFLDGRQYVFEGV